MAFAPEQLDSASAAALFAAARELRGAAAARPSYPPRFLIESARCMARHTGMTADRMQQLIPQLAEYQLFLPAALSADIQNFTAAPSRFPAAYQQLRAAIGALPPSPQLVYCVFHMSGIPLLGSLLAAATREIHDGPRHALVATRNLSWLQSENARWTAGTATFLPANQGGVRRLLSGLRDSSIERLLILVDGPHSPAAPGTHALDGLSPALAFKTGLLRTILSRNIPIFPVLHYWDDDRFVVDPQPLVTNTKEGISQIAGLLENLLRRHPEQWLNWTAASLRT